MARVCKDRDKESAQPASEAEVGAKRKRQPKRRRRAIRKWHVPHGSARSGLLLSTHRVNVPAVARRVQVQPLADGGWKMWRCRAGGGTAPHVMV